MPDNWHMCINKGVTYLLYMPRIGRKILGWLTQQEKNNNQTTTTSMKMGYLKKVINYLTPKLLPIAAFVCAYWNILKTHFFT